MAEERKDDIPDDFERTEQPQGQRKRRKPSDESTRLEEEAARFLGTGEARKLKSTRQSTNYETGAKLIDYNVQPPWNTEKGGIDKAVVFLNRHQDKLVGNLFTNLPDEKKSRSKITLTFVAKWTGIPRQTLADRFLKKTKSGTLGRPKLFDEDMIKEIRAIADLAVDNDQCLNVKECEQVSREVFKKTWLKRGDQRYNVDVSSDTLRRVAMVAFKGNPIMARKGTARRDEAARDVRNYLSIIGLGKTRKLRPQGGRGREQECTFPQAFLTNFDATTVLIGNVTKESMKILMTKSKAEELKELNKDPKRLNQQDPMYQRLKLHALTSADGKLMTVVGVLKGKSNLKNLNERIRNGVQPHFTHSVFLPHYEENAYESDDDEEFTEDVGGDGIEDPIATAEANGIEGDIENNVFPNDQYDLDWEKSNEDSFHYAPFGTAFSVAEQKKYMKLLRRVYRINMANLLGNNNDRITEPNQPTQVCLYLVPGGLPEKFITEIIIRDHVLNKMIEARTSFLREAEMNNHSPGRNRGEVSVHEAQSSLFNQVFSLDGDYPQIEVIRNTSHTLKSLASSFSSFAASVSRCA